MIVSPADHLILREEVFRDAILQGMDFVEELPSLLTLGVKPTRAETGYGYIQIGDESKGAIRSVKTFTEKPNRELAQVFVDSGEFFLEYGYFHLESRVDYRGDQAVFTRGFYPFRGLLR